MKAASAPYCLVQAEAKDAGAKDGAHASMEQQLVDHANSDSESSSGTDSEDAHPAAFSSATRSLSAWGILESRYCIGAEL